MTQLFFSDYKVTEAVPPLVIFGAGGLGREVISTAWPAGRDGFPWAILVINLSGSFLLAALLTVIDGFLPASRYVRPLLASGFCGAFTTFSAVTASSAWLIGQGHVGLAATYLLASLLGALLAAAAGLTSVAALSRRLRRPSRCGPSCGGHSHGGPSFDGPSCDGPSHGGPSCDSPLTRGSVPRWISAKRRRAVTR